MPREFTQDHVDRVRHMTEGDINGWLNATLDDDPHHPDALPMILAFAARSVKPRRPRVIVTEGTRPDASR